MTALLEFKQKIKNFYGQYEGYLLPVFRFVLALLYFVWINSNMGYMTQLDNLFIVLILALICSILPSSVIVYVGFVLMVLHSYSLALEAAGFMLVLVLVMLIFFLRFSGGQNVVLACTPLSFGFSVPALLPIGSGLLGNSLTAIPAGCGVVLFYFIRFLRAQSNALASPDMEVTAKLQLMANGLAQNWGMWITVIAFVLVILLVRLIRTRSFDYAWRVAILVGGVAYVLVLLIGSFYLSATVSLPALVVCTVISVAAGIVLEFFVFGGDYSRTERLEYEDDEYVYYVKAVPKASVTTSERSIKKINAEPVREEKRAEEEDAYYGAPRSREKEKPRRKKASPVHTQPRMVQSPKSDDVDFEKKLEESLKDL
ncbi:MAG: hypothetical protein Q4D55_02250 [Eubacteriales bacterium]|nr:hypothetical protein [Eubacteriales bacterium]